jgi:hypothetical protein
MIWIDDKLYTFFDHFVERLKERGIGLSWVQQAISEPDRMVYSQSTGRYLYDKYITDANIDQSGRR